MQESILPKFVLLISVFVLSCTCVFLNGCCFLLLIFLNRWSMVELMCIFTVICPDTVVGFFLIGFFWFSFIVLFSVLFKVVFWVLDNKGFFSFLKFLKYLVKPSVVY